MTRTDDQLPMGSGAASGTAVLPRTLDVSWDCLLAPTHRHPIPGLVNGAGGTAPRLVVIRARLHLVDPQHPCLDVAVQPEGAEPHVFLERAPVECDHRTDGTWTHLDVRLDGERILALSLTADEQPDYVHSMLPARAGFSPGMCEPPSIAVDP